MIDYSNVYILSDLDGTFLDINGREVERNLEAIGRFKAAGGLFSFATGRVIYMMRKVYPGFDDIINAPSIMCNGGCVYDPSTGSYLSESAMNGDNLKEMIVKVRIRFPELSDIIYTDDYEYHRNLPVSSISGKRINKICFDGEEKRILQAREYLYEICGDDYNYIRSGSGYLEIVDKTVTKGSMLGFVREYYEKQGRRVYCFCIGDYENDIDMIKKADVSFCPSNAIREVREICDHIVCSNNEGAIADLIYIAAEILKNSSLS